MLAVTSECYKRIQSAYKQNKVPDAIEQLYEGYLKEHHYEDLKPKDKKKLLEDLNQLELKKEGFKNLHQQKYIDKETFEYQVKLAEHDFKKNEHFVNLKVDKLKREHEINDEVLKDLFNQENVTDETIKSIAEQYEILPETLTQ